ncbi:GumC family protein [Phocaeicola massiliensis]|uniref:GumC family protein n=1 Tax=Phocaeicola massiliensis TaxID=204516 RepID=UPI00189FDAA1|nr:polysaccharide biosynthesis tyrosine autokinase [Phocaeicola massiliensis]
MKENLYDELYTEQEEQVDYKALFFKYLIHWKWFVASIVVCLIGGWIYLHYTTPVYSITGSVIIKDNKKNNSVSTGLADLEDLGFYSSTNNFDNEVEVLHSRTLLKKVVEELDLYINYRTRENLRPVELYKDTPVKVWLTPEEAEKLPNGAAVLEVVLKPGGKLSVSTEIDEQEFKQDFNKLPALLTTPYGTFSFTPGDSAIVEKEQEITVTVAAPRIMANGYANALSVEPTSKTTTIAQITLQNTSPQRGADFINKLIEIYNRDANDDKNEVASKTAEFIDERIKIINGELGTTEKELETFKRDAGLTDLKSDAQLALSENSEYEKKRAENSTQLRLVQFLSEYANNPDHAYEVLPVNVGLTDTGLTELINRYNEMLLERKRLLRTSSESNPVVVNLDASIRAMRSNVQTTILSVQKGLMITKADLERQAGKYAGRITSAPGQERQLVSISRQQEIKAGLYLMLLQKREENAITLASTANNARIVDEAQAELFPVSPKGKLIYLIAFVLGIAIPVGIIYIIELLRYKIEDRSDVKKLTTVPIIGDIPASDNMPKEGSVVVRENQNDMMAETFRNVRTNVQYMLGSNQKVVLITSTTSGEGKSFVAANLAISFALLGKKVVIVGLDIRKPGLNKAFQMSHKEDGITRYLADPEHTDLMSLLQQSNVTPNLYILPGGAIPPNPTELVARDSLVQAVDRLKKEFDYVILDTAPIGMVTDTQLISRVADMSIYVCRAGYTPKAGYLFINELRDHKKLPNLCTIINDVNIKTGKYGYGTYGKYGYGRTYGYGYGYDEKSK